MSDAFISYRRKPSAPQASLLQEKLKNQHDIDAYLDTTRADSTKVQFPERLMSAIEEAPTFILMLGDTTLESEWVLKEIRHAYELKKHCIPIFQEIYAPTNSTDPAVEYVLNFDGVHLFDVKNIMIDESVARVAHLVIRQPIPRTKRNFTVLAGGIGVVFVLIVIILLILSSQNDSATPTSQATNTQAVAMVMDALSPTLFPSETATTRPSDTPTDEPTLDLLFFLAQTQTREVQLTELSRPTNTPPPTPNYDATLNAMASQTALARPTMTSTPRPTDTLQPTIVTTLSPEQLALTPVTQNENWIPYEREIDGVTMVLVPIGSFVMGSTPEEIDRAYNQCVEIYGSCNRGYFEREARNGDNTQTFTAPFWIDKYEVSQAQFSEFNGVKTNNNSFTGDDLPVETITWFEAQAYCEARGGRLPTEAEWEYVARGPNGLIYPWGDEFDGTRTNFCDENCTQSWRYTDADDGYANTAPVNNYSEGASWVGAYQMSGNVWEWTLSIYDEYPYRLSNESINDNSSARVLRGGSWDDVLMYVRSVYRYRYIPTDWDDFVGLRCVRSQE